MKLKVGILGFVLSVLTVSLLVSCTDNQSARTWGGETTVNLPRGQHIILATWKDDDLWYLTRPLQEGEEPVTYTFQESSSWGMMEGTVYFVESR
jgi:hypothetical protein